MLTCLAVKQSNKHIYNRVDESEKYDKRRKHSRHWSSCRFHKENRTRITIFLNIEQIFNSVIKLMLAEQVVVKPPNASHN